MRRQRRLICHGCASGCRRMRLVSGARSGRAPVPSRLFAPGRLLCLFCQHVIRGKGRSVTPTLLYCVHELSIEISGLLAMPRQVFPLGPLAFLPVLQTQRRAPVVVSCVARSSTRGRHMELGSASHMAAEAQRELISRTGDHARDMRERMNRQAWAEPNFGHPAAGGALAAARSNRPSSATASRGVRREERLRPDSAISAGGAAALARQRRQADGAGGELSVVDSIDEFDEMLHSVDDLLSLPGPSSHPSPPARGRPSSASHSRADSSSGQAGLGGQISFKPRPMSAAGEPLSARARRLQESLESANGSADVRAARPPRQHTALPRHCTPVAPRPSHRRACRARSTASAYWPSTHS